MPRATFADSPETYQATLMSLFAGKPQDTEADLAKIFSPSFKFEAREKYDFDGFVAHMRRLREMKLVVDLTTVQFLRDGNQLAERHVSKTTQQDGKEGHAETFMFAEIAEDGRIEWIKEVVQLKDRSASE
ncbi:hypothetical protein ACHAQJ_007636 [Trichoderma viride]